MIDKVNARLRAGKVGVTIEQRGNKLYLVATLPPKPGSGKSRAYQQRIALGFNATPAGFRQAEIEAKKLGVQLIEGTFRWDKPVSEYTVLDAINSFEKEYFSSRGKNEQTKTTYRNYAHAFKLLPKNEIITPELMINAIKTTEPNTRSRQLTARSMAMLAKHLDLDLDIDKLKGNYSLKSVNPKELPSDADIQKYVNNFTYYPYKWAYGMLATFGLRPHEVFHVDHETLLNKGICHVLSGKTGEGLVWPLYPEWLDYFDLKNIAIPDTKASNNRDLGQLISKGFSRAKIPFSPYALRHSWARRAIEMGLDSQLAAKQMRHSHSIHTTVYSAWIDESVHQRAYDRILEDPNRIKPPV
jgi:integrase